jgi:AraC-like DNA-binding protein
MLGYLLERLAATRPEPGAETIGAAPSPGLALVKRALEAHPERSLGLERMARLAGCSRFHLVRAFRLAYRETPHRYQVRCRIEKAKALLARPGPSVTEVCFEVGFESLGSFSSLFKAMVGRSPSAYRARSLAQLSNPRLFIPHCYIYRFGLKLPPPARGHGAIPEKPAP